MTRTALSTLLLFLLALGVAGSISGQEEGLDEAAMARRGEVLAAMSAGRYAEAIAHFRKAVEVYPEHPITRGQLIYALLAASEWDEAIDLMREAISDGRGLSLSLGGRNPSISGWLAFALARKGQVEEARTIADSLSDLATREYVLPLGIAAAYTGVGDRSTALHWLEIMEEEQSTQRVWLLTYPAFDELRGDPRFEAIVGRLGLRAGPGASFGAP